MSKLNLAANPIQIDIVVDDIIKAILLYDSIQIWRSTDNQVTFQEITSSDDFPAVANGSADGPWNLNGLTLIVVKNSASPVNITFAGTDPIDLLSVINKINSVYPDIATQIPMLNRLRLTSDLKGLMSNFTLSGSALTVLGLPSNKVLGFAHRVLLTAPTTQYRFYDLDGLGNYYYKIRFYNSKNGAVSPFSGTIKGVIDPILSGSDLVTASITLSDMTGKPLEAKRIIIVPMNVMKIGSIGLVSTQDRIVLKTDQFGFASTKLAKNMTVRVYIEGSGFEREFVVPTSDFDILSVATTKPDPFSIVTTPPLAIRLSLP